MGVALVADALTKLVAAYQLPSDSTGVSGVSLGSAVSTVSGVSFRSSRRDRFSCALNFFSISRWRLAKVF
jgi:hypothetical protein